ncbi:MAG: aldehyde-activating protein [Oceanicaulis sp.]|nr:aldehyde-activating protein [Oceanicaulis sp.]
MEACMKGGCNCGAVRFEVTGPVMGVIQCHCSLCRRYTGTATISVVLAKREDFHWLAGEDQLTYWRHPDADWESTFCKFCGSPAPGDNDADRVFIPAGVLTDGADSLKVVHHIFVGSKASWDEIGDDGAQHDTRIAVKP